MEVGIRPPTDPSPPPAVHAWYLDQPGHVATGYLLHSLQLQVRLRAMLRPEAAARDSLCGNYDASMLAAA